MPPHRGHEHLINFAAGYADSVTVHVCAVPTEPIPGPLRFRWMEQAFAGRANIEIVYNDDLNPQEPKDDPAHFWEIWRESLLKRMPQPPDYVFASEPYGFQLAETLGAVYIPVDPPRLQVPISGRSIRRSPMTYWDAMLPPVRPYYLKRVAIIGPESSGKSTLAKALAAHFQTAFAPEYARTYLEAMPPTEIARLYAPNGFDTDTMRRFIRGQAASVEAMGRIANRVVFSDTEAIVTALWCEHFLGEIPSFVRERIEQQPFDLYLLTAATDSWEEEAQRVHPDFADRVQFEENAYEILEAYGLPFTYLTGTQEEREAQAVAAVTELLAEEAE